MSEYRERSRLHLNKVEQFAEWAVANGYVREDPKGAYEVLRLRKIVAHGKPKLAPLLYFRHLTGEHATSWDAGTHLVNRWLRERKVAA